MFGRWNAQDDTLRLEGWALMLGPCSDVGARKKVAHHPQASTPHVVNYVLSASSKILRRCELAPTRPPPRDFFCDARNVGAEAASLERATREIASQCLGLGPLLAEGDHFVWDRGTDEAVPPLRILVELRRRRKRQEEHTTEEPITPRRGAPHEVQRSCSGRQPWAHVLAAIQSTHARPARNRQSGGRLSGVVRRTEPPTYPVGTVGCSLRSTRTHSSGGGNWLVRHRRHWQPHATTFPRFRKLVMADCHPPEQGWQGSEQNRTGLTPLPKPVVFTMIGLWEHCISHAKKELPRTRGSNTKMFPKGTICFCSGEKGSRQRTRAIKCPGAHCGNPKT